MTAGPVFDHYDWAAGREAMLRFGSDDGAVVVVAPPLFEEANRTRALIVAVLRALALRGIASALPDLPGQGESVASLTDMRLASWRQAFADAASRAGGRRYVFAIRGGALIDRAADAARRLHLSPVAGKTLVRDLLRARRVAALAAGERPTADDPSLPGPPLLLAGNVLGRALIGDLLDAEPVEADRTLTIFPASASADRALAPEGAPDRGGDMPRYRPPWMTSEPFADAALAAMLADDIADWVRACEG